VAHFLSLFRKRISPILLMVAALKGGRCSDSCATPLSIARLSGGGEESRAEEMVGMGTNVTEGKMNRSQPLAIECYMRYSHLPFAVMIDALLAASHDSPEK